MANLKEYFDKDFPYLIAVSSMLSVRDETGWQAELPTRVHWDFNAGSKYISVFVPAHPQPLTVFASLLEQIDLALNIDNGIYTEGGLPGERPMRSTDLRFSGRVFLYSETAVHHPAFDALAMQARQRDLFVHYRGPEYAAARSFHEKPLAFICHDTRDKDAVARPIAVGLQKRMCPVWFDEYSLRVGDSLRESIEKGIKECGRCILILSKNFLSNEGWTKREFNSVFTREMLEKKRLVLPIWRDVTAQEVYAYSASLPDVYALDWNAGEEEVVRKLYSALMRSA